MVVKLVGEIDGQEIVFEHKEGDMWTTTIPKIKSGMYIISLSAYDDAGNVGFATKYIVTIDTTMLKVSLEPYPYNSNVSLSDYYGNIRLSDYFGCVTVSDYHSNVSLSDYYSEITGY